MLLYSSFIFYFLQQDNVFVKVSDKYPQNNYVGYYCPSGYRYYRHACGSGAKDWKGTENVQYGPHKSNQFLSNGADNHCITSCNCAEITVECSPGMSLQIKVELK